MSADRSREAPPGEAPVLVAGPAYCDLLFTGLDAVPTLGTERFASAFTVGAGGSAITAVALARLGRPVALLADLGDDLLGDAVLRTLHQEGVATDWVRRRSGRATPVTAVLSTPEDRAFVTHLTAPDGAPELASALRASGARHVHVAGFPFALALSDAASIATRHGATTSFDPGWDEAALADDRVRALAAACDVLLPNRREAIRLARRDGASDDASDGEDARPASWALERLAYGRGGRVTVVKDGAAGASGTDGATTERVRSPAVDSVDPTGAGDVFDAGFLDAWLDGGALRVCLSRGAFCGARAVTAVGGATAAPRRSELVE
ncbi:MAG: carbohydrate kinase family protein, partial [Trueperaceae bacterium]